MGIFPICCNKSDTDAGEPSSVLSSSHPDAVVIRLVKRGDAFTAPAAQFFPGDQTHKLEIKFEDDGEGKEGSKKMKLVVDDETLHEAELQWNAQGIANCVVNQRAVEFAWDIGRSPAKFYFSYDDSCRLLIIGKMS